MLNKMQYPDAEEEFEHMYADELEILNEVQAAHEEPVPFKSKRSLDFSTISHPQTSFQGHAGASGSGFEPLDFTISQPSLNEASTSWFQPLDTAQGSLPFGRDGKRTVEDLFGDISDIVEEEKETKRAKKTKEQLKDEADEKLIATILAMRKAVHAAARKEKEEENRKLVEKMKGKITRRIPSGPFQTLFCGHKIKLYLQFISEVNFDAEVRNVVAENKKAGLLSVPYSTLRDQAHEYLAMKIEQKESPEPSAQPEVMELDSGCDTGSEDEQDKNLWVEKYKPQHYMDLLSDETSNRTLLKWLKLWDKVVFNREYPANLRRRKKKYSTIHILDEKLDKNNCPKQKVALLSGPPGLGKTTLAHLVAKHAGYNVVEMNASDDRSPEAFRLQLVAATQMRAVLGKEPKPNCLIMDEIDGAPAAAIEVLVKFVAGQESGGETKKKKKTKQESILKRPIICICNDLYASALRPLKQIALVIQMPEVSATRIAQRLLYIARRQGVKTDTNALMALSEKTNNDIRSCLSVLQFFKAQKKPVRLVDIVNADIGKKDMHKGLFQVWQEIFMITRPKWYECAAKRSFPEKALHRLPLSLRKRSILHSVQSCGDYERLAMGVFENYPNIRFWDCRMKKISSSVEWFCDMDLKNYHMHTTQNYASLAYIPYAFVKWHFSFGNVYWPKLKFPTAAYEASVKKSRGKQVLKQLVSGMSPCVRIYNNELSLILETLPLLLHILVPDLPSVNPVLYKKKQKEDMQNVINLMLEFNMRYVQERTPDGDYDYFLDPNLDELVRFPLRSEDSGCPKLSYVVKQLIAREVHFARIQRNEILPTTSKNVAQRLTKESPKSSQKPSATPKRQRKIKGKAKAEETPLPRMTDFFQREVNPNQPLKPHQAMLKDLAKYKVWYHFKEGFSNAVRKSIKMKDLLDD